MEQMKIKIGPLLFDHVDYDAEHDLAPALAAA